MILEDLEKKYDKLKDKIIDLSFKLEKNKEIELLELVKDLLNSLQDKEIIEKLSKEEIIENLKNYIHNFIKNYNIKF